MSDPAMRFSGKSHLLQRIFIGLSCALFPIVLVPLACGQTSEPRPAPAAPQAAPPASNQTPDVSTHVDEVPLDMVVRDGNHNVVLDLKPEDLLVTDNGVPVKLTEFRLVDGGQPGDSGHMVTLLFDSFHGPIAKSTRIVAEKILSVLPRAGYSLAVLDIEGRLRLLQGFTDDRAAVEQAVETETASDAIVLSSTYSLAINIVRDQQAVDGKTKTVSEAEKNLISIAQTGAGLSGNRAEPKERARAQSLVKALQDAQAIVQEQHAQLNLAALLALVKSQQRLGGRRALIYFTRNQQMDAATKKMLKTIGDAAAEAGVSIYAVDMDALGNSTQYQAANALLNGQPPYSPVRVATSPYTSIIPMQQQGGGPIQGDPSPDGRGLSWGPRQDVQLATDFMRSSGEDLTDPFADTKSPMADLAKSTGGSYIDALNSIKKPLQQMVQDLTTYYQASYVPPFKDYDGKLRAIAVKPMRTGLKIQTRTGYFALAPGVDAGVRPFEFPLLKALAEPQLPDGLKFHAALLRFGELPDGNSSTVAVEVPLSELETKQDAQTNLSSAHLAIVAQVKDMSGMVIEHYSEDFTKRGARESLDRDSNATISLARHFISAPGKYTMEVAVLDQNSGKMGARRMEFEIPDSSLTVSLSDMVLVRKMEGSHEEEEDPLEPLRYEHQKVTPNITGELSAKSKGVSLFFILHPNPALNQPSTLEMQVIRNGKAGERKTLMHIDGVHTAMPYLASLGSDALPAGDYEVKSILTQGGNTSAQSASFRVAGVTGGEATSSPGVEISRAELAIDIDKEPAPTIPQPAAQLPINPMSSPAPALSQDEARLLIEDARQRALEYTDLLPNFTCIEVTTRSVDAKGDGKWRLRDTLEEQLRYSDKIETRTALEIDGVPTNTGRDSLKGALSAGEFGGILQAVFGASSKADFRWKETNSLNSGTVQVYDYRVDRGNSQFSLMGSDGSRLIVGFHGQVFVDSATRRPRRITLIADDPPPSFSMHATSIGVDYDYVPIKGLKYLMPVSAKLQLNQGHRQGVINTMEFRDYKRFEPM